MSNVKWIRAAATGVEQQKSKRPERAYCSGFIVFIWGTDSIDSCIAMGFANTCWKNK